MKMFTIYHFNAKVAECEMNSDQEIIVGRDQSCTLVIDDHIISRKHLQCFFENDRWHIKCLARFGHLKEGNGHIFSQKEIDPEKEFECWMDNYRIHISLDQVKELENAANSHTSLMVLENQESNFQDPPLPDQDSPDEHPDEHLDEHPDENNDKHLEPFDSPQEEDPNRTSLVPVDDSSNEIDNISDNADTDQTQLMQQGLHSTHLEARLKVLKKMGEEDIFVLEGTKWVIGRSEDCEVALNHPKVSRMHFEIIYLQDEYYIKDLKSSNGTCLNGKKINHLKPTLLNSGDRINVEDLIICFEICNTELEKKIEVLQLEQQQQSSESLSLPSNISLQTPEIMVEHKTSGVVRIPSPIISANKKKKKLIRVALIGLVFAFIAMSLLDEPIIEESSQKSGALVEEDLDEFNALTPQQKSLVVNSYLSSIQLYEKNKYNVALTELQKIHDLISSYKDSREFEKLSIAAVESIRKQDELRQAAERQNQLMEKVTAIIDQCTGESKTHTDMERLQSCLEPALEIDPENSHIQLLLEEMNQKVAQAKLKKQKRKRYLASVISGKKLYDEAKVLHDAKQLLDAFDAYQKHIKSKYPDPDNLKEESQKSIDKIRQVIDAKIDFYHNKANQKIEEKDYRTAILLLRKSLDLDPTLVSSKTKMAEYSEKLNKQMKALYAESVLEENLGNIEDAKKKWKDIVSLDVRYGKYYKKAKKKLKQYL